MTNKTTTIQISQKTKERLMKLDKFMTKSKPTHDDRIIWLLDIHM